MPGPARFACISNRRLGASTPGVTLNDTHVRTPAPGSKSVIATGKRFGLGAQSGSGNREAYSGVNPVPIAPSSFNRSPVALNTAYFQEDSPPAALAPLFVTDNSTTRYFPSGLKKLPVKSTSCDL